MKGMRNIAPFGLRMPDDLREAIAERAKLNGRSMNSEIIQILENALSRPQSGDLRIILDEADNIEIDPADYKSVINGLAKLVVKLQANDNKKKP